MECNHEQPMQFVNRNYLQVEGRNHGVNQQVSKFIISIAVDTLFRVSTAFWITTAYLHPKIMYCLEQYSTHLASSSITSAILFLCIVTGMSSTICFILLLSHIISIVKLIDYANETLVSEFDESFLLLAGNLIFYAAIMFAIVTLLVITPAADSVHVKSFLLSESIALQH